MNGQFRVPRTLDHMNALFIGFFLCVKFYLLDIFFFSGSGCLIPTSPRGRPLQKKTFFCVCSLTYDWQVDEGVVSWRRLEIYSASVHALVRQLNHDKHFFYRYEYNIFSILAIMRGKIYGGGVGVAIVFNGPISFLDLKKAFDSAQYKVLIQQSIYKIGQVRTSPPQKKKNNYPISSPKEFFLKVPPPPSPW